MTRLNPFFHSYQFYWSHFVESKQEKVSFSFLPFKNKFLPSHRPRSTVFPIFVFLSVYTLTNAHTLFLSILQTHTHTHTLSLYLSLNTNSHRMWRHTPTTRTDTHTRLSHPANLLLTHFKTFPPTPISSFPHHKWLFSSSQIISVCSLLSSPNVVRVWQPFFTPTQSKNLS